MEKKMFYTQDNKCKNHNTSDKNSLILIDNINNHNDNFYSLYNNKYNSLSNILKSKKMISSPVLDFGFKNLDVYNNICNKDNDNDIKAKNKDSIDSIEKNNNNTDKDNINKNDRDYLLNSEIEQLKKEII